MELFGTKAFSIIDIMKKAGAKIVEIEQADTAFVGIALGTSAHVMGTSKALGRGEGRFLKKFFAYSFISLHSPIVSGR